MLTINTGAPWLFHTTPWGDLHVIQCSENLAVCFSWITAQPYSCMPAGSTCGTLLQESRDRNCKHTFPNQLKMQKCTSPLLVSLILCATISQTFGLVLSGKEKRGWTLNSAGYLLGPHAIDNHRSFNDKQAGKRELQQEENIKSGNFYRTLSDDNVLRTLVEFLTYLHLKESGALDNLSLPMSSEETTQS